MLERSRQINGRKIYQRLLIMKSTPLFQDVPEPEIVAVCYCWCSRAQGTQTLPCTICSLQVLKKREKKRHLSSKHPTGSRNTIKKDEEGTRLRPEGSFHHKHLTLRNSSMGCWIFSSSSVMSLLRSVISLERSVMFSFCLLAMFFSIFSS